MCNSNYLKCCSKMQKKKDPHHDISQWTMNGKVFFVDERLCLICNYNHGGGPIICFRCSLFFLGVGSDQSSMLLINIEPNKMFGVYPGSWPTQQKLPSWVIVFFGLFIYGIEALTRDKKKKKSFWHLWKMHINKTQETPKVPKVRRDHDTPRPNSPNTISFFFNLPWNPIILSVLCQ
jgi:hypothetical protein